MKKSMKFFLIVVATVIVLRFILAFVPASSFVYNDFYHHVYIGVLLLFVLAFYNYQFHHKLFYLFAIALGLIVDELVYLLPIFVAMPSKESYFSWVSFASLIVGLIILYLLKDLIVREVKATQTVKKKKKR